MKELRIGFESALAFWRAVRRAGAEPEAMKFGETESEDAVSGAARGETLPGEEPGRRVEKIEEVEPVRIGALRGEAAPAGAKPALSGEDERAARALVRRIAEACHMEESHVEIQLEYE